MSDPVHEHAPTDSEPAHTDEVPDPKVPGWSEDFLWHKGRAYARDEVLRLLDGGER